MSTKQAAQATNSRSTKPQNQPLGTKARRYPKPGPAGGRLIRQVIRHLKAQGFTLPLDQNHGRVLIACSGGADSVALAHLLSRYGRKIIAHPRKLRLLHVNHGWRGQASDEDAAFVRQLAKKLGARFTLRRVRKPSATQESWENLARKQRKRFFQQQAEKYKGIVLTAHQADDVAETLLWRILTGQADTHAGGIAVRHGVELRPFLTIRKKDLKDYLKEEGQEWHEDATNQGGRFLRSRLRMELMPILEHIFPKAVEHLGVLAERARERTRELDAVSRMQALQGAGNATLSPDGTPALQAPYEVLFGAAGLQARRPHWESARKLGKHAKLSLPGGWTLQSDADPVSERWILQKDKSSEV